MALNSFFFTISLLLFSCVLLASASDYGNTESYDDDSKSKNCSFKPDTSKPKPEDQGYSPKQGHGYEKPLPICIEGLILCKSGLKYYPIPGAVAKITCLADDKFGSKTTSFSITSKATDSMGYFLSNLSSLKLTDNFKLKECKVYLDNSPFKDCKIPTDVNKGITGALLHSYRVLEDKKIKLYWVGPFFFTSESKSIPTGY